jgi:hypothetical protein
MFDDYGMIFGFAGSIGAFIYFTYLGFFNKEDSNDTD